MFLLCGFIAATSAAAFAQTGSLSGVVTSEVNRQPVGGVSIEITKLRRSTETDAEGRYEFTDLPAGTYTVVTHIDGFADKAQTVTTSAGGATTLDFGLSLTAIRAEVTVTATGSEEAVLESFSSVSSIGTTQIAEKASTSIGDVLESEAGVSKRSFGPGSARPSIRGFEGDRVQVLQDGAPVGSVGAQSGDHSEPVSTLNLERLEVIKGPATLLYGSSAVGGVVNAVTNDENDAHPGIRGYFTGLGGTVNRQGGAAGGLEYGVGKYLFNLDLNAAREGNFETPLGRIPNSGSRAYGGSGKFGYFADKAFIRGTISLDRRRYGVPYAPLFESGEVLSIANGGIDCSDPNADCQFDLDAIKNAFANQLPPLSDEDTDIKMRRNGYRLTGGFRNLKGAIPEADFRVDFSDYQHQELEVAGGIDTVATTFDNDVFSYRAMFHQANYKKLSGSFGFDGYRRSYLTQGEEQLVDGRVRQNNFAVFALEELNFDRVSLQFGGRIESNRYRPVNANLVDTDFTGFSGAVGAKFRVWKGGTFVTNLSSSFRSPALEELYNFGPHVGTVSFEVGDPTLERERTNGLEFSLRQDSKRVRFNGSFFVYDINNFIYGAPQDEDGNGFVDVEDGLPLTRYKQNDSRFIGADANLEVDLNEYVGAYFVGDVVRAELKNINVPLPRISPARGRIGLNLRYKGLSLRPEAVFVAKKGSDDVFTLETPTAGYGLFNINGTYAFAVDKTAHIITFGGQNLTDKLYRNHVNFIKDLLPEAGRGFKVSYTVRFY
ncbi:MAG: TonB-dependent receptor [Pyrinomonadaceae bacterium]